MEAKWKDVVKWIPVVGLVLAILIWLFKPSGEEWNRK